MSRNNVFKLSGNMALGAQDNNYNNNDFENIKSSLKLLKSKQPQKRSEAPLEPTVCISLSRIFMEAVIHLTPIKGSNPTLKVINVTFRICLTRLWKLQLPTHS